MKLHFAIILFFFTLTLTAQSRFNAELLHKIQDANPSETIQVLVLVKPHTEVNFFRIKNSKVHYQYGNIYSVTASVQTIKALAELKHVLRIEYIQHQLKPLGDTCVVRNRIKDIKAGIFPLSQPYDGSGVIIGIIDSGTDFNHPDFKDVNGKSRIKFLWDMSKPLAVNTPTQFGYGQEWNHTEIDMGYCTHNDMVHFGHGTNSSGIAAGNGYSINRYEGMAPKADLIVVAVDFSRPGFTIADAVEYIISKSTLLNKPLVINASVGDYYGSHDGTDLETQVINNMVSNIPGRALVAACGNGGSSKFHVGYNVIATDTNFTWIKTSGNTIRLTEYSDTNLIKNVKYSVGVTNPGFKDRGSMEFKNYSYALDTLMRDTIFHNTNRIGIVESVASINPFGVYELNLTIKADSVNYFWGISHSGTGRIDSWDFNYYTGSLPDASQYPKIIHYKAADTIQSIVSGFQCSDEIIAVGNYINRNRYYDFNNSLQVNNEVAGQLHHTSSTGPTRDNRIKPDITASGATILASSPLAHIINLKTNAPYLVAQGGYHVTAGGTSSSSPVVAGLAALYFQRQPTATNRELKQAIVNCAYQDVYTTNQLPNNKWGCGKLDGFATMTCGEVLSAVSIEDSEKNVILFPNPFTTESTLQFPDTKKRKIKLYNSSGQLVLEDVTTGISYQLKQNNLSPGLYLVHCEENSRTYKIKALIL
ncbi:MAG: peptidase and in kexin sedolisin [Bacteroidota bacterium]|jgi:subtilisin family serine protease|nr:peptidase and in kexin sedolisin [Bacteroidota bacterium]